MLVAALDVDGRSTALHLGGGAVTLPRLLQDRLPRLRQRVVELEPALVELIAETAPLPEGIDLVGDGARRSSAPSRRWRS